MLVPQDTSTIALLVGFGAALINCFVDELIAAQRFKQKQWWSTLLLLSLKVVRVAVIFGAIILVVQKSFFPTAPFILSFFLFYFIFLVYHITKLKASNTF